MVHFVAFVQAFCLALKAAFLFSYQFCTVSRTGDELQGMFLTRAWLLVLLLFQVLLAFSPVLILAVLRLLCLSDTVCVQT